MGKVRLLCVGVFFAHLMLYLLTYVVEGRRPEYGSAVELLPMSYHDAPVTPKNDRIYEVERSCKHVIASASELRPNDNRGYIIRHDLSFAGGDWDQKPGSGVPCPLVPFLDYNNYSGAAFVESPAKLSGFRVTDVNNGQRTKKTVSVNGVLDLDITRERPRSGRGGGEPRFQMSMGHTHVSVFFQGVYTESEDNGGERVMCLLGRAMLPVHQSSAYPWGDISLSDPMTMPDDQILLVLRYPMEFTLTQRAIQGEMKSLWSSARFSYFDKVEISSQLSTDYKFGSPAVKEACPYSDHLLDDGIDVYKGYDFCSLFEEIQHSGSLAIIPNLRCNGPGEFCGKLGPFVTNGKDLRSDKDARLVMQNVRCEQKRVNNDIVAANVSLVLRFVPGSESTYLEKIKSGWGNMTLAAEGVWSSSKGQLCMVGCLGIVDAQGQACDSRVCFYVPTTLSIHQRSALVGSISSLKAKSPLYFPLSIQIPIRSRMTWRYNTYTNLRYMYSKIGLAKTILSKDEPSSSSFQNVIKKSLLNFPRMQENEDFSSSLSNLAEDLTFHVQAVLHPSPSSPIQPFLIMDILTVNSVFSSNSRGGNYSRAPYHEKAQYTTDELLVNVSAQLSIYGMASSNFSSFFLEGVYDQRVGKMYLAGCRNAQGSDDLEGGYDCSTEVVISYPSVIAQWLRNPGAQVSIKSQRQVNDPLYFKSVTLKTSLITYRSQREDALSEKQIEGILRASTLSVVVACIVLQLIYIRRAEESVPYVSLIMLGIQALGYSLPLFTGMESLFKRKHTESNHFGSSSYELEKGQSYQSIDSVVKVLILVAFLLTLRLLQKVWKSRVRLLRRAPHEPGRVPNEKLALLITSVIHVVGFICVISFFRSSNTSQGADVVREIGELDSIGNSLSPGTPPRQWMVLLEEYTGLVQDLFLFPQVVGNLVWQVDCRPLRKVYYVGISLVRVLPHVYDYFKSSTLNPYFSEYYEYVERDTGFYSKFSDILIPVMTLLLVVLVYVQQRWSYNKISDALVIGHHRLLPIRSNVYQKLPSRSVEAELSSSANGTDARDQEA